MRYDELSPQARETALDAVSWVVGLWLQGTNASFIETLEPDPWSNEELERHAREEYTWREDGHPLEVLDWCGEDDENMCWIAVERVHWYDWFMHWKGHNEVRRTTTV